MLFGFANEHNYVRMFLYAALVIFGAGIFDMVDGRVARQTTKSPSSAPSSTRSSTATRDVVLFFGLLVYYGRINRFRYVCWWPS